MIGLALSGGGSRAVAFHLGCLRALNDLRLLDQVRVLSTISGGSVIGAYFAYTPQLSFEEFDDKICAFLRRGLHKSVLSELARPRNLTRAARGMLDTTVEMLVSGRGREFHGTHRRWSRSEVFCEILKRELYPGLTMSAPRRRQLDDVVIGACELMSGSAFRFGNSKAGGWRNGELVDWDVEVGFAVAASAAYPLYLPAFDRTWRFRKRGVEGEHRVLITDGGIYDNLGLQVLEPNRDAEVSLHAFPCEYLIVCNAGQGQSLLAKAPNSFFPRVRRSFDVVHRRVQDSAMHRLHRLKQDGYIKGFILPYLGQQDGLLPWKPTDLVPRSSVVDYPTNFAAMSKDWIRLLADRGEQLTRGLVDYYLTDAL
jgi:NTE family protein